MCFSAEADFAASAVIGVVGVATLTKVDTPRELPLGALPLALAAHQGVEGFVWLGHQGDVSPAVADLAANLFVAFAWVVLPVLLPLCILLVERDRRRRRAMAPFVALGGLVALYLFSSVVTHGVSADVVGHTIRYRGAGDYGVAATVCYVVATCGPPLVSRHPPIVVFGALNLVAVVVIGWVQADGVTSLWCLWAAAVSVLIYAQLAAWRREARPAALTPAPGAAPAGSGRASAPRSPSPAARRPR